MWVRDHFIREILAVQQQDTERYGLLAEIRRQERRGEDGGAWRWRIEPGMEEAFGDLQDWLLSSQQEAAAETAALAERAARLREGAYSGAPDQSPVPVGWPVLACCSIDKRWRMPDAGLALIGSGVSCCAA